MSEDSDYEGYEPYCGIWLTQYFKTAAENEKVIQELFDTSQEFARSSFADMLHDTERNKLYYKALRLAIDKMHKDGKKANVLDIGAGAGLLSMMAAKCGADTVTACEGFEPVANSCREVLAMNGCADKIKVIPKHSTKVTVGEDGDMKQKANILVTEVFDTELIGEGALSTFDHAHKHLLEENCIVVPDSAVIYAQVIECPFLQKWNKIDDVIAPELDLVLKTPQKMKECPGSAAVHDIQLSQVPRSSFRELSDKIPVLHYDWSGKTPIKMKQTVNHKFKVEQDGTAQMVFMWWELNMDAEGEIVLSCAPWWKHPAADLSSARPEDSVPWRDHWMQAVYYLPKDMQVATGTEPTLVACQDEYSLWFYIQEKHSENSEYPRPNCDCGIHMSWSRTHVSYLNNESENLHSLMKREIKKDAVILDLYGSSLLGLLTAKMAKNVYIYEKSQCNLNILKDYIETNNIKNVAFISELDEEVLRTVTNVISYPVLCSSILPWENLIIAHFLYKNRDYFMKGVSIIPKAFELWAMPVEFLDLHKIKVPVERCEEFDMSPFDQMVRLSRKICDADIEPQPLWEYPCTNSGTPRKIFRIEFDDIKRTYAAEGAFTLTDSDENEEKEDFTVNGFALWAEWSTVDKTHGTSDPSYLSHTLKGTRERVKWDPHTRQGVKILYESRTMKASDKWSYKYNIDFSCGKFDVAVDLVDKETVL